MIDVDQTSDRVSNFFKLKIRVRYYYFSITALSNNKIVAKFSCILKKYF